MCKKDVYDEGMYSSRFQEYFEKNVVSTGMESTMTNYSAKDAPIQDTDRNMLEKILQDIYKYCKLTKKEIQIFEDVILLGYRDSSSEYGFKSANSMVRRMKRITKKLQKSSYFSGKLAKILKELR